MRIFLAPMEGVVDFHMRRLLSELQCPVTGETGIDVCVTEFIRVTDHILPNKVFLRSCPELAHASRCPVRVQLLGSNPEALAANARRAAKLGAPAIDLNFGCPAKTVNRNRGGACLLDDTKLIEEIVARVREAVPSAIPVTAKIRLGYSLHDSYLRNAIAIERAGANELVVHARSKVDGYQPPAYWSKISEIKQSVKIPVIANGEVWNVEDYIKCAQESNCMDVMLGRGALAMPDLALGIKASVLRPEKKYTPFPWAMIAELLLRFFFDTRDAYPNKYMGNRVKQWLHYLQRNYPEAGVLFNQIKQSRDPQFIELQMRQALHA